MTVMFFKDAQQREQRIAAWVSTGVLIFASAFLWAPSRDGLEAVYALSFFIPMLCLLPWRKPSFREYGGWFTVLALVFGGYSALTNFWAPVFEPGYFVLQFVVLASWLCGLGWMAQRQLLDPTRIIRLLIAVGAVMSVVNLVVFYSQHPWPMRLEGWSVTRNPNSIGSIYAILTLMAYMEWLRATRVQQSVYYLGCALLLVLSVVASENRAALGGLALFLPITGFLYCRSRTKCLFQVAGLVVLAVLLYLFREPIQALLLDRGMSHRDFIWHEVYQRAWAESPLWGIGLEEQGRIHLSKGVVVNHAHNAWLDMFYRTGLIGVGLSLVYLVYLISQSVRRRDTYPFLLWLLFGCLYISVDSRGFFWQIDPKWFCIWLPAGIIGALISTSSGAEQRLLSPARETLQETA